VSASVQQARGIAIPYHENWSEAIEASKRVFHSFESRIFKMSQSHFSDDFGSDGQMVTDGCYVCENCGEEIVIPLDIAAGHDQEYVEDCPVCCSPSVIHVQVAEDHVEVWAQAEQDRY